MKTKPLPSTLNQYKTDDNNIVSLNKPSSTSDLDLCNVFWNIPKLHEKNPWNQIYFYTFSDIPFPKIETRYEDNILFFSELDFVVDIPLKGFSC